MLDMTRYTETQQVAINEYRAFAETLEAHKKSMRAHRAVCEYGGRECGACLSDSVTLGTYENHKSKLRRQAMRKGIAGYALVVVYEEGFENARLLGKA